ncbi:hypothetical protein Cs7R123_62950 [Catellatospora sp. TT07R-123]|uniref:hypothetical protein n=1 Tax=Catellatospora sp. TT07R-123 TaxID=2733863 RepID=UPI001B2EE81B|nr:hypothetical protein [Catellatospora sp. TT07R-123]GHJ48953.1 hypothetical protein Cs7R123_62950 [Catellatospora sp. TT07R-123]
MSEIDDLREQLAGFGDAPGRLNTLVRLGQALLAEYHRVGPGRPEAKPHLDQGIAALAQAYEILRPDDAMRGPVAAMYGFTLAARHGSHGGADGDCDTGISVLEEALTSSALSPANRAISQVMLGQLYLARASRFTQLQGMSAAARSVGVPPPDGVARDFDRATACLRSVIDGEPVSADLAMLASRLLEVAEAMRTILDAVTGDVRNVDFNRIASAFAMMQTLQDKARSGGGPGFRLPATGMFDVSLTELVTMPPMERPVAVVQLDTETDPVPAVQRPAPAAPPAAAELRESLSVLRPGADAWSAAAELLLPGTPTPDTATVDEMVALALTVVEATPPAEAKSAQAAVDRYVLAVALLLRGRGDEASSDRAAALAEYATAAALIPPAHPAAPVILRSLGAFLSDDHPLDDTLGAVAGRLADRIDGAILAGVADAADLAVLDALRCLCRAAEALADLRRAAGKVPADYPWPAPVKAAGLLAASAA